jgi:hypothetical protein
MINEKIQRIKKLSKFPINNFHTELNHLIREPKIAKRIMYQKAFRVTAFKPESSNIKLYKSTIPSKLLNTSSSRNFTCSLLKTTIREDTDVHYLNTHADLTKRSINSTQILKAHEIEKKFGILSTRKKKINITIG